MRFIIRHQTRCRYATAVSLGPHVYHFHPRQDGTQRVPLQALSIAPGAVAPALEEYRWLVEELRVSLFAQELGTPRPISVKRLDRYRREL